MANIRINKVIPKDGEGWDCVGRIDDFLFFFFFPVKPNGNGYEPVDRSVIYLPEEINMTVRTVVKKGNEWECDGYAEGVFTRFYFPGNLEKPRPGDRLIVLKVNEKPVLGVKCTPETKAKKINYEPSFEQD